MRKHLGRQEFDLVEIVDGLEDSDLVVTVGQVGLKDDATVTIINAVEEAQVSDNAPID